MFAEAATIADMRKSAFKLLKEGGTPEVVSWADTALNEIKNDVETAIIAAHDEEEQLVNDNYARFAPISDNFAQQVAILTGLQSDTIAASSVHVTCRQEQCRLFNVLTNCREEEDEKLIERDDKETAFITARTGECALDVNNNTYIAFHERPGGRGVSTTLKDHSVEAYKTAFVELKRAVGAHQDKHAECEQKETDVQIKMNECNELKQKLESASCASHSHLVTSYSTMVALWELLEAEYLDITATVTAAMDQRKIEWETLAEVKCLLNKVKERGGKPCEAEEDAGDIAEDCKQAAKDSSALNITIPSVPTQPARPHEPPHPCTDDFVQAEYLNHETWGHGHCYESLPACQVCPLDEPLDEPADEPAPPPTWERVACEHATPHSTLPDCTSPTKATCHGEVRYGHGTTWTSKTFDGEFSCSNAVFGDPWHGQAKECQCLAAPMVEEY